jgi:hypothetical protein
MKMKVDLGEGKLKTKMKVLDGEAVTTRKARLTVLNIISYDFKILGFNQFKANLKNQGILGANQLPKIHGDNLIFKNHGAKLKRNKLLNPIINQIMIHG